MPRRTCRIVSAREGFHSRLREYGYKLIQKEVKWYTNDDGTPYAKANADLDMAVDALIQSTRLDRVLLVTADGDFVQVVRALQANGCRVEVVAFDNASGDLQREADMFMSGYLIPNLIPTRTASRSSNVNGRQAEPPQWGEDRARVRGFCYYHHESKPFGFFRYLTRIDKGTRITDARDAQSPFETVFFDDTTLPQGVKGRLPSRRLFFEFSLNPPRKQGDNRAASEIELLN